MAATSELSRPFTEDGGDQTASEKRVAASVLEELPMRARLESKTIVLLLKTKKQRLAILR